MTDFDVLKDIPGYKAILKAVLKNQIQMLVEQLSEQTGEESVILTASVSDGTLSHLGSESGKFFLEGHDEIKSQFLGFCLKRHHKRKSHDTLQVPQPKRFATATHSTSDFPPVTVNTEIYSSSHNPVFDSLSPIVHPVSLSKVKQKQRSPFTKAKVNRESLHIARLNVSLQQNFDPQKEHGLDMTTSNRSSSNLDSFSDTVDQNNLKSVGELRVNIKKEAVDSEEGTNNMTDKDKIGPSTEDIQERNDSVEETVKDNTVAAVKVEADDEDHELEITGVEGDISNQSLSDSQMYMQNFSGTDGQSSSIEVPPYNMYAQNDSPSGMRGGRSYITSILPKNRNYAANRTGDCEGLIVTRGGSRVEKLIKCDLCGNIYRTSNMARHKKRYCKAIFGKRMNDVAGSTSNDQRDEGLGSPYKSRLVHIPSPESFKIKLEPLE